MHLKNLHLLNFKNYEDVSLDFSPHINCFLGENGGGKTNLLDAIFYLSFCKSFFNPADSQNIRFDAPFMVIQGAFERKEQEEKIYCGLKKGQKKQFKRNKKEYEKLADHIGLLPLVMISPADADLIHEGSDLRRRFLDLIISQYNKTYLDHLMAYNKALSQRNRLLKSFVEQRFFDLDSLEIWDEQLERYGTVIYDARKAFIAEFLPLFQKHHDFISGSKESVSLDYQSQLADGDWKELLAQHREKDRRLTYSSMGVHKDDLLFKIADHPIKKFGSQGQQKTYLLALKLAQAEYLRSITEIAPILLLDDIYDKLDDQRLSKLMEVVRQELFGQVFITDTHAERIPTIFTELKEDFAAFNIKSGKVERQ